MRYLVLSALPKGAEVKLVALGSPIFPSGEVRQGAQGAFRVAPGKSGLLVRGEGERVIALEPWPMGS